MGTNPFLLLFIEKAENGHSHLLIKVSFYEGEIWFMKFAIKFIKRKSKIHV